MKNIPIIDAGYTLELKKPHPCGNKFFLVNRVGSDIKMTCTLCGRTLTLERVKVEKMIKNITFKAENDEENNEENNGENNEQIRK